MSSQSLDPVAHGLGRRNQVANLAMGDLAQAAGRRFAKQPHPNLPYIHQSRNSADLQLQRPRQRGRHQGQHVNVLLSIQLNWCHRRDTGRGRRGGPRAGTPHGRRDSQVDALGQRRRVRYLQKRAVVAMGRQMRGVT